MAESTETLGAFWRPSEVSSPSFSTPITFVPGVAFEVFSVCSGTEEVSDGLASGVEAEAVSEAVGDSDFTGFSCSGTCVEAAEAVS